MNLQELKAAISRAEEIAGTDKMSVFIFEKGGSMDPTHPRVVGVDALRFVDPGEVNWSLYIFVK